jgi:hypothetical protein
MNMQYLHSLAYTGSAEDFRAHHLSAWIDIDPRSFDAQRGHVMYTDFIDLLECAADVDQPQHVVPAMDVYLEQ